MIYRCSKCGMVYNQMKQFKKRVFPGLAIYYTTCCDTSNIEIIEINPDLEEEVKENE